MPRVRFRWFAPVLVSALLLAGGLLGWTPRSFPVPAASLLTPQSASAQVSDGGSFGSAVPCLEAPDQFVTSCFANTLVAATPTNGSPPIAPVASSDTALVRFNTSGKTPLANLGQIGSVYGMAYDDGRVSGVRRLFLGAFARRMTAFGPGGPGAIYAYNLTTGSLSIFTTLPGTTNRHAGDPNDAAVAAWVGKSSLGDLEIGPTGTTLYALNLDTRQIDRRNILSGAALASLPMNFGLISANPAVQADLRPFGMEFQGSSNYLFVGVVDSGERSPNTVVPTAHVIAIDVVGGAQTLVLSQPLDAPAIAGRLNDGASPGPAWRSWVTMGKAEVYPMPLVSDIQFSRDGQTMLLGLRDRNGDVYRDPSLAPGEPWWRVQEQGDILAYTSNGAGWTLQTRGGVNTPSDFFKDDYVGSSTSNAHVENSMGAFAWTLTGAGGTLTEQIVGTAITTLQAGTTGANWYNLVPGAYPRQAAVELVPQGDMWKSATLGDLESLCTTAFVGDRVWNDLNGNGVQDGGEPGIGGVLLNLRDGSTDVVVAQATTDANGIYLFAVQPGAAYSIQVDASNFNPGRPLFDRVIAPQNRGGNDAADSDADQISRRVAVPAQLRDANTLSFDIGVMRETDANGEIGNFIWNDLNSNGVQDGSEPGITNITVRLLEVSSTIAYKITTTSNSGAYQFINVIPGTYQVEFVAPAGINATTRDAGGNDGLDSDADASTGWRTPPFDVVADTVNMSLDLGLLMNANVWVQKSGPPSAVTGSQVDYTLAYGNDGAANAANVLLVDTLPGGVSFVSASPAPSSVSGQTLAWSLGTLPPSAAGAITVRVQIAPDAPASVTNRADISTTTTSDTPGDNSSSVTTQVTRPNVTIWKSGPAIATAGDQVSYTLSYGNTGSAAAQGVVAQDTLPADMAFVSASPAPSSASGQALTWNLGTLNPGQSGTITVVARASANAANGAVATNQAAISTITPGDDPSDNSSSTSTTLQRADVQVVKSSPTTFPVTSGGRVTYYLDFSNAGPAAAANVTLADTVPPQLADVTWSCASGCSSGGAGNTITIDLGTLAAGATGRVIVSGTARSALSREDFTNTATITTTTPETDTANNQSSVPGAVWTSDAQLIKLAQAQVAAGETFTTTLLYKNNGPAPASDTLLSDTLPNGTLFVSSEPAPSGQSVQTLTWNLGQLADGQEGRIELVLRSDPALADGTTVVNQAQIAASADRDQGNNQASAPTLVVARADLAIVKTAPARVTAGDEVDYTLSYRNNGPSVSRAVVISDTLPAELEFVGASPAPSRVEGGVATWQLGDLAPGQAGSIAVLMRSRADQHEPTLTARNTAQIGGPTTDPAPDDNTSTAITDVETPDVSVVKRSPTYVVAGRPFTVTLEYANAGPATAAGVMLRDLLPSGLAVVSASPPPSGPGLRWSLGDLAAGASGQVTLVLRAPTTAISGTAYTNVAVIDIPAGGDRDPSNDTSSTVSTVRPNADLSIVKSGPAAPIRSGSVVTYTLAYRNDGPSQALDVEVEDTPPPGFSLLRATPAPTTSENGRFAWQIGSLDAGASGSITVVGTLVGDGATTARTNTATIGSPSTPDPQPDNNTSSVTSTVLKPDLSVTKTDGVTEAQPGDTLTYTLRVHNSGPVAATGVALRETPPAEATVISIGWAAQADGSHTLALGDVAPGQTITATFVIRLPNPLGALTSIVNAVVVTDDGSAGPDPTPGDGSSTDVDAPLAGRIGDMVWHDRDGDGQQDGDETGLVGIGVQLIDPATSRTLASATTDATGRYSFGGLRMGTYAVALAPQTTQLGALRGFRYTTAPTPVGSVAPGSVENMTLDIGLNNPGTTDVTLAYLRAERSDGHVTVAWRTLDEVNTARFRVLRGTTAALGEAVEIGARPSLGSGGGAYSVVDAQPPTGARYWLIEVERGGREIAYGPLSPRPVLAGARQVFLPFVNDAR